MTPKQKEYADSVERNLAGLEFVSPGGALADCPDCPDLADCSGDCGTSSPGEVCYCFDEGGFSWSPCEVCDSHLGGNRYDGHGRDSETDALVHLSMCEDCLCYLANGDLPADEGLDV